MNDGKLSVEDMASVLGVSERTVIMLAKTEQIPSVRINNEIFFYITEVIQHFKQLDYLQEKTPVYRFVRKIA